MLYHNLPIHFTLSILPLWGLIGLLCIPTFLVAQKSPPVANQDFYVTGINAPLNVSAGIGLLANDTDINGSSGLTIRTNPVSVPTSGSVNLNADGSFVFTPASGSSASAIFEYQVCDDGAPEILVSRFDFDSAPLTTATVGPNATSIDPDVAQTGCGVHIPPGRSGGNKGLDLVIPNTGNIFDFTSFRFDFEYRDQESQADIATAGNFRVYHITGDQLGLQVSVINGSTGLPTTYTVTLGSFLAGNTPYTIAYDELSGNVIYTANGGTTTTNIAPLYSSLDVSLATAITIGKFMDNSGRTRSSICSIAFTDTSILCDTGRVTVDIATSVVTNRRITYRAKKY